MERYQRKISSVFAIRGTEYTVIDDELHSRKEFSDSKEWHLFDWSGLDPESVEYRNLVGVQEMLTHLEE